ncbi:hypothetical protein PIB30_085894 [Stylosanthes scabra]|uniref:Uncharacterized protein n=1 Tax=Stylosanthes scabra TaxID=79078 RepID=A0ABU6ST78_9FABA|nr:hypothetical protein [Stylosanthes scabra]
MLSMHKQYSQKNSKNQNINKPCKFINTMHLINLLKCVSLLKNPSTKCSPQTAVSHSDHPAATYSPLKFLGGLLNLGFDLRSSSFTQLLLAHPFPSASRHYEPLPLPLEYELD